MSISQISAQQSLRAVQAVAAARANAAVSSTSNVSRQPDAVNLSDAARSLSVARQTVSDAADVRTDRVAAIKAALADGSYKIDSTQLARSMLASGVFGQGAAAS